MHKYVSETAQYGDLTRGPRVINAETRQRMREVLAEIQDGRFAREWVAEYAAGNPHYKALKAARSRAPHRKSRRRAACADGLVAGAQGHGQGRGRHADQK
ncbi:protein containing Acetohydroxy acid isomeroreductase, partial [mine drainage metagenome]